MKSFCVGFFALLAIWVSTAFSKPSHDRFYELFKHRKGLPVILNAVYDNDSATQLEHLDAIQRHIDAKDEYFEYAKVLKSTFQQILDNGLRSIGRQPMDIVEYMKIAEEVESGETVKNQGLVDAINQLNERKQQFKAAPAAEKVDRIRQMLDRVVFDNGEDEEDDDDAVDGNAKYPTFR